MSQYSTVGESKVCQQYIGGCIDIKTSKQPALYHNIFISSNKTEVFKAIYVVVMAGEEPERAAVKGYGNIGLAALQWPFDTVQCSTQAATR